MHLSCFIKNNAIILHISADHANIYSHFDAECFFLSKTSYVGRFNLVQWCPRALKVHAVQIDNDNWWKNKLETQTLRLDSFKTCLKEVLLKFILKIAHYTLNVGLCLCKTRILNSFYSGLVRPDAFSIIIIWYKILGTKENCE